MDDTVQDFNDKMDELERIKSALVIVARGCVHEIGMAQYTQVCELLYPNSTKDWPK